MTARKPKAQRERVVVAFGVVNRHEQLVDLSHTRWEANELVKDENVSMPEDGPHRVVRLEGRVKV